MVHGETGRNSQFGVLGVESSPNIRWQEGRISREQRWRALDSHGATIWLTGLPASGKSTIGAAVEERLIEEGRWAYLLDGDNLRHGICGDLGFSAIDREKNVRRVGEVARLFADCGAIAIVALISPLARARQGVRAQHEQAGLPFLEVFVDTPLELCVARDPKGLYARALEGELRGMTGVDDPYEPPAAPELRLTPDMDVPQAAEDVLRLLETVDVKVHDKGARR
jgi:adenylyl-sulfate kinase